MPAGTHEVIASYIGLDSVRAQVRVAAGQRNVRDFDLTTGIYKLDAFTVSSAREGNSKAVMAQRRDMNIITSVSSDIFGDVADGNVGEFLKYLPGVEVEYVDGISRGPRVGGLDQQYVGVTMDGAAVASADAFVAYGSTLNGAAGSQSRSVGFEQMSINAVESIEISRTLSPDMDANSPAGSINMRTRRAFEGVCDQIRRQVADGTLQPGHRLPSDKELADQFRITRSTVREALRSLEGAGVVEARTGLNGGVFIKTGTTEGIAQAVRDMVGIISTS